MEWNVTINGKELRWQTSESVAVVPSRHPRRPGVELDEPISKYRPHPDDALRRREQDRRTFEQAGWQFIGPTERVPEGKEIRQVFTTERGDILIEPDVATVQLNAACVTKRETAKKVLAEDGLTIIHELSFAPHLYVVRLPAGRPLPETINALQAKPHRYVFVEPSMLQRISGRQDPTDPQFGSQWQHSDQFGLHSVAAWEITKGQGVRIAIIDNGMNIEHDELKNAIVGGGYFENRPGSATATFVRYERGMTGFPVYGHGTFCMGMAGARANNGNGGCGIAPLSDLLAIACAPFQTGSQLMLARAIQIAVNPEQVDPEAEPDSGADVISCSLASPAYLETVLEMAINSAASGRGELGVPIFWAVDNDDTPISMDTVCSLENVIAVGRSDKEGQWFDCGRGPELEFLAPGFEVFGPLRKTKNDIQSGTSFATPLAAGVAALVIQRHRNWTAQQVLQRLRDTCDMPPHPASENDRYGHGRINAFRAVQP